MMKRHLYIAAAILLVAIVVLPHPTHALCTSPSACVNDVLATAMGLVLKIVSLITYLAGIALNYTVSYTVVAMKTHLTDLSGINIAWGVIRDVANMLFIFVLLYTSFMTIFGEGNYRRTIVNMIIAAILINFSLFFTKVVIDAGNALALTFYSAIAPNADCAIGGTGSSLCTGIADSLMQPLNLQSIYDVAKNGLSGTGQIITIGVMGSVFEIVAAFVMLAVALMFVVRYVVLLFVLVLSPIYFVSMILPDTKIGQYKKQWAEALINQTFFPLIYFILTWIVIVMFRSDNFLAKGSGFGGLSGTYNAATGAVAADPSVIGTIFSFVIVIGLLIISLIVAKSMASKGSYGLNKIVASGGFGLLGSAGRNTFGKIGTRFQQSSLGKELEVNAAKRGGKGDRIAGAAFRLANYATKKTANATYDIRNATVPTGAVSDLVRGTVGRTEFSKKWYGLGLDNEFDTVKSIQVGAPLAEVAGAGKGATLGFKAQEAEDKKKWAKIREEEAAGVRLADAELNISKGMPIADEVARKEAAAAATGAPAYVRTSAENDAINAMEKSISKMTDKEIENLVNGDKKLLKSQAFANRVSVQQLEALMKSDKFNDDEKDELKSMRFKTINDGLDALSTAPASRTPAQEASAKAAAGGIRGLSDKELEFIDPQSLSKPEFIGELKGSQIEAIMKSSKFTPSQKKTIRDKRKEPLVNELQAAPAARNLATIRDFITKKLKPKDVAGLMGEKVTYEDATGATVTTSILIHPDVLPLYTINMLKRMAPEMDTSDIAAIRSAMTAPGSTADPAVATWLTSANGQQNFS